MIFNIISLIVAIMGIFGLINKNFNLIGIILSIDIIAVSIFLNLIIFGYSNNNIDALVIGFLAEISLACLNAVAFAITYVYFEKKGTLDVIEIARDN